MSRKHTVLSIALLSFTAPAFAGPVADFEAKYDQMYAGYRSALFATNSGNAEKSTAALQSFGKTWTDLLSAYGTAPPPQYEDDAKWSTTMSEVSAALAKANEEVATGDLAASHVTLEAVREAFSDLHARNGIETFSDRMNAYHAEMERVLDADTATLDAPAKQRLLEHAAVLAYLAGDVMTNPPPQAQGNAEFDARSAALQASVDAFLGAARAGDDTALKAAIGGLKVPYSKLFLKFG
jgi:hypothetical protein